MEKVNPQSVSVVKTLMQKIINLPIEPSIGLNGDKLILKAQLADGEKLSLIHINLQSVEFWAVPYRLKKDTGWQRISHAYMDKIVKAISGASIKVFDSGQFDIRYQDRGLPVRLLQGYEEELVEAMTQLIQDANAFYALEKNTQS
jgi:hypothetical protein